MRVIIEGSTDKITVIKKRFRGFGVKFIDDTNGNAAADVVCNDLSHTSLQLENDHLKSEIETLKAKLNRPPVPEENGNVDSDSLNNGDGSEENAVVSSEEADSKPVAKAKGKSKK